MLIALIFMVKGNAAKQAQEFVKPIQEKAKYQIGQVKDITDNNNLLWSLVDSTWKSPDKSKAFVKKLADSQKVPRCGGKACTGDDARLKTTSVSNAQERSITVGWGEGRGGYKYWFKVIYDPKDKFLTIDVNDLLGKSTPDAAAEEERSEEAAGE
jgi:formyltetrahydrofolate synthetase